MVIDCHTHISINNTLKASVNDLLLSMDNAKIDRAFVFGGMEEPDFDYETGYGVSKNNCPNEWMLEQIAPHKDRLFGVAAAHPVYVYPDGSIQSRDRKYKEAQQLANWYKEGKIVAVKFYTGYDHLYPNEVGEYLITLQRVGCPVIFHSGDCYNGAKHAKLKYAHPLHIDEVAVDYPDINFIIAHMGNPWIIDAAEVCYKNKNVYTDISGFVYGAFSQTDKKHFKKAIEQYLEIVGNGNKLLFGTDFPISDQKSYIDFIDNEISDLYGMSTHYLSYNVLEAFKLKVK